MLMVSDPIQIHFGSYQSDQLKRILEHKVAEFEHMGVRALWQPFVKLLVDVCEKRCRNLNELKYIAGTPLLCGAAG